MDFLKKQMLVYTSKEYEDIYKKIQEAYGIKYAQLFMLCCSLGFKKGRKISFKETGREFRSNYLNDDQRVSAYSILLNDRNLNITLKDFENQDMYHKFRQTLEEYAQGGMEVLIEEAFPPGIKNYINTKKYDEYLIDIMSYIYNEANAVPF